MSQETRTQLLQQAIDSLNLVIAVVGEAQTDQNLNAGKRTQLVFQFNELREVRDQLVLNQINVMLDRLGASSDALSAIADTIDQSSDELRKIAENIATAAKVIGVAASIAARAASSGLVG